MKRYLVFIFCLLLLATLACTTVSGTTVPETTPTTVATPTLASTATPDPNTTPVGSEASPETLPGSEETIAGTEQPASDNGENTPEAAGTTENGGDASGQNNANYETSANPAACPAGGQNLLLNASFEGEYKPFGAFNELNHAPNWFPWWQDGSNNLRPEFKPADAATVPNRVHSGGTAQQYFKSFGQFKAGMYQSVLDVTPGTRLQFSAHGQAWSCEEFGMCPNSTSVNPANMLMRVGIDPTGDTSWSADTVVWSAYFNPLDQWQIVCVEAVAERDIVTVYLWASPDGPRQNQDIYWDDAGLVVIP